MGEVWVTGRGQLQVLGVDYGSRCTRVKWSSAAFPTPFQVHNPPTRPALPAHAHVHCPSGCVVTYVCMLPSFHVYLQVGAIESEFRVFSMELLAGEAVTETEVIQHGTRFRLDFAQVRLQRFVTALKLCAGMVAAWEWKRVIVEGGERGR